jgi:hypothetical protein
LISLVPEPGGRERPPLEDLIATPMVQQREIVMIGRRTQADRRALIYRLHSGEDADRSAHATLGRAARPY